MDIQQLLQPVENCACGVAHACPVHHVATGSGALASLPAFVQPFRHILLVADDNTDRAAGDAVRALLGEKTAACHIYHAKGFLVPDETAVEALRQRVTNATDLILGIGSGVINDLCKYVSFLCGLPYVIVATAPSMDGFASAGAAMIAGGMKITYPSHVPFAIVADTDVLKNAPMDMIRSGFGDVVGKYSCLSDWKLAALVRGEYFCPFVYDLTTQMVQKTVSLAEGLLHRDPAAVTALTEALIGVGIAMAYVGNSRPASGSEHHLSHYFEITGILRREPYFHHGIDVGYATIVTSRMRERILSLPAPREGAPFDETRWEKEIRRIYGSAAEGVLAQQRRLGWYDDKNDLMPVYREKWREIREILAEVPSAAEMTVLLGKAGFRMEEYEAKYSEEKRRDAAFYAKDLKDRYTVLWLYDRMFRQ